MSLRGKDVLATLFVATAAVVYALWASGTAMSNMSTRAIGWIVFGLGWAACTSNQSEMAEVYGVGGLRRPPMRYVVTASILGAVALVAGVITLVSANEALLATLVASMIALWVMSTIRHAISGKGRRIGEATREPLKKAA